MSVGVRVGVGVSVCVGKVGVEVLRIIGGVSVGKRVGVLVGVGVKVTVGVAEDRATGKAQPAKRGSINR